MRSLTKSNAHANANHSSALSISGGVRSYANVCVWNPQKAAALIRSGTTMDADASAWSLMITHAMPTTSGTINAACVAANHSLKVLKYQTAWSGIQDLVLSFASSKNVELESIGINHHLVAFVTACLKFVQMENTGTNRLAAVIALPSYVA